MKPWTSSIISRTTLTRCPLLTTICLLTFSSCQSMISAVRWVIEASIVCGIWALGGICSLMGPLSSFPYSLICQAHWAFKGSKHHSTAWRPELCSESGPVSRDTNRSTEWQVRGPHNTSESHLSFLKLRISGPVKKRDSEFEEWQIFSPDAGRGLALGTNSAKSRNMFHLVWVLILIGVWD